jgi:hypothetical protein
MSQPSTPAEGFLRNTAEQEAVALYARLFEQSPDSVPMRLAHVTKYMRRQDLTRLLTRYEIFKRVLPVKGSIIECGVFRGSGLMAWANFSAVLEPFNLTRRIYGFDSFEGFPSVGPKDSSATRPAQKGELRSECYDELTQLIRAYDLNRALGHIPKVELVRGDATETIPAFVASHPHLVVSLLFLDFDLYEPTKAALEHFLPRMPRGAVVAFDELDNPSWPGETLAVCDGPGLGRLRLERLDFDPYVAFAVLD